MKLSKYLLSVLALLLFFSVNIIAQDVEMTEEEWEAEMARLQAKKQTLQNELTALREDIDNLKSTLDGMQNYEDCIEELYAMVGATEADVDQFRRAVAELEGMIKRREGPKAERQQDLNALKQNKISALPEFYDKVHVELQEMLDSWVEEPKEIRYTVVKGDHLWKIAGMNQHYDNSFAWPKIWKANKDKIKDPDLIYPDQVFTIPKLTDEEKAYYEKLRRNYKPTPVQ